MSVSCLEPLKALQTEYMPCTLDCCLALPLDGSGPVSHTAISCYACSQQYDITLVSPRSFFLFTALLPQVTTGSLEERSITESIRKILRKKVSGLHGLVVAHSMQGREQLGGWAGPFSHSSTWPFLHRLFTGRGGISGWVGASSKTGRLALWMRAFTERMSGSIKPYTHLTSWAKLSVDGGLKTIKR